MSHHENIRQLVRNFISQGGSQKEACLIFGVSRSSVYRWLNNPEPAKKSGKKSPDKIDTEKLLQDVRCFPDKLLRERAELFDVTIAGISLALKRLGIKKNSKVS